jgi:hypothetical protein
MFYQSIDLTDDQFYDFCRAHPEVKFERGPAGHLIIMAPTKRDKTGLIKMGEPLGRRDHGNPATRGEK